MRYPLRHAVNKLDHFSFLKNNRYVRTAHPVLIGGALGSRYRVLSPPTDTYMDNSGNSRVCDECGLEKPIELIELL